METEPSKTPKDCVERVLILVLFIWVAWLHRASRDSGMPTQEFSNSFPSALSPWEEFVLPVGSRLPPQLLQVAVLSLLLSKSGRTGFFRLPKAQ